MINNLQIFRRRKILVCYVKVITVLIKYYSSPTSVRNWLLWIAIQNVNPGGSGVVPALIQGVAICLDNPLL